MEPKKYELLDELEYQRSSFQKKKLAVALPLISGAAILFILLIVFMGSESAFVGILSYIMIAMMIGLFIAGILVFSIYQKKLSALKAVVERDIVKPTIESFYEDCEYSKKDGLSYSDIKESLIVPHHDVFNSSNLIVGKSEGVSFVQSSVFLQEKRQYTDNNGVVHTSYITTFNGIFTVFSFPKKTENQVIVSESFSSMPGFRKVQFESIDFNKKFKTFSKTELDAFKLITPLFIDEILGIEREYPGLISFSFYDNFLVFAINERRPRFQVKMNKPINIQLISQIEKDAGIIRRIVKSLRLNQNIF